MPQKKKYNKGGGDRKAIRRRHYLKYREEYRDIHGVNDLSDKYIKKLLCRGGKHRDWPPEMIKLKRAQILLHRAIKRAREKQKKAGVWGKDMSRTGVM